MRFFKAIKVAFRKKESNPEMVSKLIGRTIARGEYISKYGSIDDGFSLGEPYKNERGDWRWRLQLNKH